MIEFQHEASDVAVKQQLITTNSGKSNMRNITHDIALANMIHIGLTCRASCYRTKQVLSVNARLANGDNRRTL